MNAEQRRRLPQGMGAFLIVWIGQFVALCAESRPPWRVAGIRVYPSESARGYARVALTLEGIERAEDSP